MKTDTVQMFINKAEVAIFRPSLHVRKPIDVPSELEHLAAELRAGSEVTEKKPMFIGDGKTSVVIRIGEQPATENISAMFRLTFVPGHGALNAALVSALRSLADKAEAGYAFENDNEWAELGDGASARIIPFF